MQNWLKSLDIRILILSRSKYETITTHKILPEFIEILVPESQKSLYEARVSNPIITIPDDVKGLGMVRNWVLDNFQEETVIMVDDDIIKCYCFTGKLTREIKDRQAVLEILVNAAIMAKDLGTNCFGFNQTDIRKYKGQDPFNLCTWVGGVIGVIGREQRFRNDKFKVDVDFCLQTLMNKRVIWCDTRFGFSQKRDNNRGGNSEFRTSEAYDRSIESLKAKWGDYIKIKRDNGSQVRTTINVKRKQSISL